MHLARRMQCDVWLLSSDFRRIMHRRHHHHRRLYYFNGFCLMAYRTITTMHNQWCCSSCNCEPTLSYTRAHTPPCGCVQCEVFYGLSEKHSWHCCSQVSSIVRISMQLLFRSLAPFIADSDCLHFVSVIVVVVAAFVIWPTRLAVCHHHNRVKVWIAITWRQNALCSRKWSANRCLSLNERFKSMWQTQTILHIGSSATMNRARMRGKNALNPCRRAQRQNEKRFHWFDKAYCKRAANWIRCKIAEQTCVFSVTVARMKFDSTFTRSGRKRIQKCVPWAMAYEKSVNSELWYHNDTCTICCCVHFFSCGFRWFHLVSCRHFSAAFVVVVYKAGRSDVCNENTVRIIRHVNPHDYNPSNCVVSEELRGSNAGRTQKIASWSPHHSALSVQAKYSGQPNANANWLKNALWTETREPSINAQLATATWFHCRVRTIKHVGYLLDALLVCADLLLELGLLTATCLLPAIVQRRSIRTHFHFIHSKVSVSLRFRAIQTHTHNQQQESKKLPPQTHVTLAIHAPSSSPVRLPLFCIVCKLYSLLVREFRIMVDNNYVFRK